MHTHDVSPAPTGATVPVSDQGSTQPAQTHRRILLVRHGQTTYNVEGRLPGQLPGVALTDEGRRQAQRAAVALSGLPLSAVISSPLERARDTAEIIARGWGLPVRLDNRLMDTDVGRWSGQKIADLERSDPEWKAFVQHASQAPSGIENLAAVMERAVAVAEHVRHDPTLGDYVVLVAHADVIKLIVGHYLGIHPDCVHFMHIDNASVTALDFHGSEPVPTLVGLNWTVGPGWLAPPSRPPEATRQAPGGAESPDGSTREPTAG
ncbi:MAG: hypothetical protein PVSMB4_13430 [Ktedonobacterales bacterium]